MKKYKLMKTDYVTSCIFQTNDLMEMKNKIIRILGDLNKSYYYALSGISKLRVEDLYFDGCWVDVWIFLISFKFIIYSSYIIRRNNFNTIGVIF